MPDRNREDDRSDLEQRIESRFDDADAAKGGADTSPLEPTASPDGAGGAGGLVRNQDENQQ